MCFVASWRVFAMGIQFNLSTSCGSRTYTPFTTHASRDQYLTNCANCSYIIPSWSWWKQKIKFKSHEFHKDKKKYRYNNILENLWNLFNFSWTNPFTFFQILAKISKTAWTNPLQFSKLWPKIRKQHGLTPLQFSKFWPKFKKSMD